MISAKDKRAFMLFEVVVSIAIVAGGILFVLHSFYASKRAVQRSAELVSASVFLDNKMSEIIMSNETQNGGTTGNVMQETEYTCTAISSPLRDFSLEMVTVEASKKNDNKNPGYKLSTYLKRPE